jgi:hypothetical protein
MCGNVVTSSSYSFQYPSGVTVTVSNESFSVTGNSLSGGFDWVDDDECDGTGTLTGVR